MQGAAVACDVPGYTWMPGRALIDRDRWPVLSADGRDFGVSVTSDGRLAFGQFKTLKEDAEAVEKQSEEIKARYSKLFGV